MFPGIKKYPHIFSSIKIGKLDAKNRIKYASTETNFNYRDGYVSDKEVGYMGMMAIWDDKFIVNELPNGGYETGNIMHLSKR